MTTFDKSHSFSQQQLILLNPNNYKNLIDVFEESCQLYRDKGAYNCFGQTLSFADVEQASRNFAAYLSNEVGLKKGDRIAIQLPNINQYPIVAWGALRAGLILVNTNPLYTARELIHQFNDAQVKAVVVLSDLLPMIEGIIEHTSIETVIATNALDFVQAKPIANSPLTNLISLADALNKGKDLALPKVELTMDDVAVLQYTGGTTGVAKGAVLTHGSLFASNKMSATLMDDEEPDDREDIVISPMPLYHVYGFTMNVVGVFINGGLSILIPDPRDIGGMLATMKQFPFSGLAGVNTLFVSMLNHPDFDSVDFSNMKGVISGGAALVEEIATEWFERTGSEIFEGYGLSETASALSCNTPGNRQLGTVGKIMKHMEIKVVNAQGTEVPTGSEGELLVRGPHLMQGYWQRKEATAEVLDSEGWFKTGDVVVLQSDGFLKIVDRLKDMVLVSGFNVYPNEIEAVVYGHPDILECAVIGIPSESSGEAVKLFVASSNPSLTETELKAYCRENLTGYKVPKFYEFRDVLPKSNVGKILRKELR